MKQSIILLFTVSLSYGQTQDTLPGPWTHGLVTGLTATQVSFTDWSQGGQNAFSWTASLDGKHAWAGELYQWGNSYNLAYGQAEIGGEGIRRTADKIDLESIAGYQLEIAVDPYVALSFKSQFARGYIYRPIGDSVVSDFFDPAYITASSGLGYQPIPEVRTRLGAALRQVVTSKYTHYADDPATSAIEKTRLEGGLESVTNVEWKLDDDVVFSSKLELFAAIKSLDVVIVRNDNTLAAKINSYLSVNLNLQIINDRVASPRTQLKQMIAFGFSYVLI
jgi:hypothetical protein